MKILFFIESLHLGGKERRLVELIKGLKFFFKDIDCQLVLLRDTVEYSEIHKTGFKIHNVKKKGKLNISLFYKFYKICKKYKPDIIHTWGALITILAIPSSLLLHVPILNNQVTANTVVSFWNMLFFYKVPFLFSKYIVSNSKKAINVYNIPNEKAVCIYNGFDFTRINNLKSSLIVKRELGISTKYLVGMVASFVPLKDYKTFIKSALNLLNIRKDVTFLCVGNGNKHKFIQLIPKYLKKYFLFLDAKQDIENIMNACDIGILSSFNEGMPNVVIEFMALGKPVIATEVGGIPELITDNIDGFLVPIGQVTQFANNINKLFNNNNIRKEVGENAKNKIKKNFEIKKMIDSYMKIYNKALGLY